jgi:hypothetical protein
VEVDRTTPKYVAGAVACLVLGLVAYAGDGRVPLLGWVDLGFHELGHLLTYPLPEPVTAIMGSVAQVAVPLGLAAYFWLRTSDPVAAGLCLAWAGTSCRDVAVYVADAPYERLVLIGGDHDWAFLLHRWDALDQAATIATGLRAVGIVLVACGIAACVWRLVPASPVHR